MIQQLSSTILSTTVPKSSCFLLIWVFHLICIKGGHLADSPSLYQFKVDVLFCVGWCLSPLILFWVGCCLSPLMGQSLLKWPSLLQLKQTSFLGDFSLPPLVMFRYCFSALSPWKVFGVCFRWAWLDIFSSIISPTDLTMSLVIDSLISQPNWLSLSSVTYLLPTRLQSISSMVWSISSCSIALMSSAFHSTLACQMPGYQIDRLFHCSWTFCHDIIGNALVW